MSPVRVQRVELSGIGPFESTVLEFPATGGGGELFLFEGPNGSGKTTIAQALAVAAAGEGKAGNPDDAYNSLAPPFGELRSRFVRDTGTVKVTVEHDASVAEIAITSSVVSIHAVTVGDSKVAAPLQAFKRLAGRQRGAIELADASKIAVNWAAMAVGAHYQSAMLASDGPRAVVRTPFAGALSFRGPPGSDYKLKLGQVLINLDSNRSRAAYRARGEKDHDTLNDLQQRERMADEAIRRIQDMLTDVLERQVRFDFPLDTYTPRVLFDGREIPVHVLGEGMRQTFSWLSDVLVRLHEAPWSEPTRNPLDASFWLILDEVESSLHPKMQARILPAIRRLFPNANIYATTHSPFVVASLGEGYVFSIRPDRGSRRVNGQILPTKLEHGQSLDWVIASIFDAPTGVIDLETADWLRGHQQHVDRIIRLGSTDWGPFLEVRDKLMALNDEVRAIVGMAEVPVSKIVRKMVRERLERASVGDDHGPDE